MRGRTDSSDRSEPAGTSWESPARFGQALAERLDSILLRSEATLDWIAVPWLHLLNEHPVQMLKYRRLMRRVGMHEPAALAPAEATESSGGRPRWKVWVERLRTLLATSVGRSVIRLPTGVAAAGHVDVLIVSALVDPNHLDRNDDFYFGQLQDHLARRGLSSLLILRNTSATATATLRPRALRDGVSARVLLPEYTKVTDELKLLLRALSVRRQMHALEAGAADTLTREVRREARRMVLSGATLANYRLHAQMLEICTLLKPGVVIGLYEGHAVEHCLWHAARRAEPPAYCVGYQHTTLWEHSHAVRRTLGHSGMYDPDLILTVGGLTRRELARSEDLRNVPTMVLGSHRFAPPQVDPEQARHRRSVLVVPEGYESECVHLFQTAIDCARLAPGIHFILRTHPILPFERVRACLTGLELQNVEVSVGKTMHEDFARSGACLYRGSSTVLYAILAGLKPFYLEGDDAINLDPVYSLREWRETVRSAADLKVRLQMHFEQPPDRDSAEWEAAREFCADYVRPFDERAINEMLRMAAANRRGQGTRTASGARSAS